MATWVLWLMVTLGRTEGVTPTWEMAEAIARAADGDPRLAATLVAVGWGESRFQTDAVGDHGQSVGPWQISRYWKPGETVEEQAMTAARLIRLSWRVCKSRPLADRLAWYAAGGAGCPEAGVKASQWRMRLAAKLYRETPYEAPETP